MTGLVILLRGLQSPLDQIDIDPRRLYRGVEEQAVEAVGWMAREYVLVHSELSQTRHIVPWRWPLRG